MEMKTWRRMADEHDRVQRESEIATLTCCGAQARLNLDGVWVTRCVCEEASATSAVPWGSLQDTADRRIRVTPRKCCRMVTRARFERATPSFGG